MERVKGYVRGAFAPLLAAAFTVFLVLRPGEAVAAAREGAALWFGSVLPALLPFCVGVNLLRGLGVINLLGGLLTPLTRWAFGVSGAGGCALALGMSGGYPVGAKTACELRASGRLGREEAQRLLGFVNNSGPMFIVGALGAGMFHSASVGRLVLAAHYLGAFTIGVASRVFGGTLPLAAAPRLGFGRLGIRAGSSAVARGGIGRLLPEAVGDAAETVLRIGGFMMCFAVIARAMDAAGVFSAAFALARRFAPGAAEDVTRGLLAGALEMTTGAAAAARAGGLAAYAAAAAVVSWGGASIHAQTMAFIAETDLSAARYLLAKGLHGALAAVYTALLYPLFKAGIERDVYAAVFAPTVGAAAIGSLGWLGGGVAATAGLGLLAAAARAAGLPVSRPK